MGILHDCSLEYLMLDHQVGRDFRPVVPFQTASLEWSSILPSALRAAGAGPSPEHSPGFTSAVICKGATLSSHQCFMK